MDTRPHHPQAPSLALFAADPGPKIVLVDNRFSGAPFLGSEALAAGRVSRHELRAFHRRVFPGVYVSAAAAPDPDTLLAAAALWAPAGAVVCGMAAARLHGERWFSPRSLSSEVELYTRSPTHDPPGIRSRRLREPLPPEQVVVRSGITATSVLRTAVDLARWEDDDDTAIAKIDAVCNRSRTEVDEVRAFAAALSGLHGLRRVRGLLRSCDHLADSPQETRLRLIIERSHLPTAVPQLRIYNEYGAHVTIADFAYPEERVAIFYDGTLHRRGSTWEHDARVNAELAELGWQVIRVTAQMLRDPTTVLRQIESALARGRSVR